MYADKDMVYLLKKLPWELWTVFVAFPQETQEKKADREFFLFLC